MPVYAISLQIGGHKIHIEAPKNCDKLSCLQISAPSLSGSDLSFKGFKSSRDDDEVASRADQPAQKAAAPVDQAAAPQPPVAAASSAPSASKEVASTASVPIVSENIASLASVASPAAPKEAAVPKEPAVAATPVQPPTTPLGVWNTEKKRGDGSHRAVRPKPLRKCRAERRRNSRQHEAVGYKMDWSHS